MGTKTKDNIKQQIDAVKDANFAENSGGSEVKPADPDRPTNTKNTLTNLGLGTAATKNFYKKAITLMASRWTGSDAPFKYDLGGEYFDSFVVIDYNGSSGDAASLKAMTDANLTGGDGPILFAWGNKPTVDIPIVVGWFK